MGQLADNLPFLKKKLDIDHGLFIKKYINIQKMAWEQILLLCFYSRQRCYDVAQNNEITGFMAKMKLVHEAYLICGQPTQSDSESPNDYGLLTLVLELLDNGKGSVEITQVLLKHQNSTDKWSEECGELLQKMEINCIAFSVPSIFSSPLVYSHYAMYKALSDPISLFQPLLYIEDISSDEVFEAFLINYFRRYVRKKYGGILQDKLDTKTSDTLDKVKNITSLEEFINTNPELIDKTDFSMGFKVDLMVMLGDKIKASFETVKKPIPEKRSYGFDRGVFNKMCTSTIENESLTLTFDKNILRDLSQLGLIDEVIKGVKSTLLDTLFPKPRNPTQASSPSNDYGRAFDELSNWYLSCKTDLFKKLEQVPRLIATVVALDIKHKQGFFSIELNCGPFKKIPEKIKAEDVALITTNIIHHCLFKNYTNQYYTYKILQKYSVASNLEENTELAEILAKTNSGLSKQNDSEVIEYPSRLMINWQDVESLSSAVERIKKLPIHLRTQRENSKGTPVYMKIYEQRNKGIACNTPYPITTSIPLPLWVSYVQENQVSSENMKPKETINESESDIQTNTAESGESE
ncbi:hypothetical protein M3916_002983 [Vibrio parahaemolyticus]|nr:hypothetical protein [Vibrio parahaemolyticus]